MVLGDSVDSVDSVVVLQQSFFEFDEWSFEFSFAFFQVRLQIQPAPFERQYSTLNAAR